MSDCSGRYLTVCGRRTMGRPCGWLSLDDRWNHFVDSSGIDNYA
jgi:hypothetical protein